MKLYQDRRAPNPRRVRIFLAEKGLGDAAGLAAAGLALERVDVDIAKGEHQTETYRAVHPLEILPVLELDDGRRVRESIAICRWFEERVPTPALFGADADARVAVEEWTRLVELELFLPITFAFRHTHAYWQDRIEQVPRWGELSRIHVERRMAWLDGELAGRRFLAGDAYSVADITALCALDFGKVAGIRVTDALPALARWYAEVSTRPSAKA